MAKSPLCALIDILSNAVDYIDSHYADANLPFPTLDVPFEPAHPSSALITDKLIVQWTRIMVAAAEELSMLVRDLTSILLDLVLSVTNF
jgi:hypothetical protein